MQKGGQDNPDFIFSGELQLGQINQTPSNHPTPASHNEFQQQLFKPVN